MTNLSAEELDDYLKEMDYAEETGQEPGICGGIVKITGAEYVQWGDTEHHLHRLTGPAAVAISGIGSEWYYHGTKVDCNSQEEFIEYQKRILKLKAFW